ncbi:type 1 glutamine amidotransferase domain-containing protein [Jannaschia aquimarina]|uniref:YraA protein n=1 Tax=Jannaschia aquimarina TaxID=935700 RepID=A0A0D1D9T1_9RHOB|nr:type 1 glutamine amidotransferase domain-containing protein [Jannaschia aquimarina]KIT16653.1 putative cysteine protease YraA [Jannaschia aquimarina]SNS93253.1 protease I [Jannaschia aquimarina]
MTSIQDAKVLILATDGFEQSELIKPLEDLRAKGATVQVASPESGHVKGWSGDDWGDSVPVDLALSDADEGAYHALVLPGGQINPDLLRVNEEAIALIRAFAEAGKPIAAICHAPWLLIEAGLVSGRRVTGYPSIRTDLKNAGAQVEDSSVVRDGGLITSRNPDDLGDFVSALVEAIEGDGGRAAA